MVFVSNLTSKKIASEQKKVAKHLVMIKCERDFEVNYHCLIKHGNITEGNRNAC